MSYCLLPKMPLSLSIVSFRGLITSLREREREREGEREREMILPQITDYFVFSVLFGGVFASTRCFG